MTQLQAWLVPQGFEKNLMEEFQFHDVDISKIQQSGHLFYGPTLSFEPLWAQDTWDDVKVVKIKSVSDAASVLRSHGRNWFAWQENYFHRTSLILKKIPKFIVSMLEFPHRNDIKDYGSFALLAPDTMIYSNHCKNPFPGGIVTFNENKIEPPSRAYLKLWEVFTRIGVLPKSGQRCLDVGACPGGWTWVMQNLGCHVLSVDRTELSDSVMELDHVTFRKQDAFKITPKDTGAIDWLVSDLICEPQKLYDWVLPWIEAGACRNFICTLKMKGNPDFKTIQKFQIIAGSQVVHLYQNKHELTWVYLKQ